MVEVRLQITHPLPSFLHLAIFNYNKQVMEQVKIDKQLRLNQKKQICMKLAKTESSVIMSECRVKQLLVTPSILKCYYKHIFDKNVFQKYKL
jgi:hypothetical protein